MTQQLSSRDREFFSLVSHAGFINPFSDERHELELQVSNLPSNASRKKRTEGFISALSSRIAELEAKDRATITAYSGEDRKIMEKVFLIELFYRYKDKFDELIQNQIAGGNVPAKVPFYNETLAAMTHRGFEEESFRRYFALAFQVRRAFYFIDRSLVGNSPCMRQLRWNLWNNVFTHNIDLYDKYLRSRMEDFSTLLIGETGTGKGTAAQAIGRSGFIPLDRRRKIFVESFSQSFISLNLSQFPETLIESALFGHRKGAFTGAMEDYQGVFDRCSPYGAILLDEIGEVSYPIQIKLLQVLQERVFSPVGSQKQSRFQGRVIAATNRSQEEISNKNVFRSDFYYRLCSDIIVVPPLRQRIQENPAELNLLLATTIERLIGKPSPELVDMIRRVIDSQLEPEYPWPGNVRELEQCARRVLLKGIYAGERELKETELDRKLINGIETGTLDAASLVSGYCYLLYQRHPNFEEVGRRTGLDRRTVKKYIREWAPGQNDINGED